MVATILRIFGVIPNYNQQDATFLIYLFIYFTEAVLVSGGSSAHHPEHITICTASVIVNQYCCWLLSWVRCNAFVWSVRISHPQFTSRQIQGGSNMTGTDLCVNKPHCAAAVRP